MSGSSKVTLQCCSHASSGLRLTLLMLGDMPEEGRDQQQVIKRNCIQYIESGHLRAHVTFYELARTHELDWM